MKVEIDLNDILGDESGAETLQESVRRQVIDQLTRHIKDGIGKRVDTEIARLIQSELATNLKERMPALIDGLMDLEYTPVDRWGDRANGKVTTFRKQLVQSIQEQMVYKQAHYDSDKNVFTKAVDEVIRVNVDQFKTTFNKLVNETFTKETLTYAMQELRKKFGIVT